MNKIPLNLMDKILLSGFWIFVLSLMTTKSGLDTSVAIITIAALFKFLGRPSEMWRDLPLEIKKFFISAGIFLAIELAGIFISTDVVSSVKRWVIHLGYFGLFGGMFLLAHPTENITKFVRAISAISVLVAVDAALQHFYGYDFILGRSGEVIRGGRVMGTLGYPNDLGMLLGVLLPFLLAGFISSDSLKDRIILGVGFSSGIFSLVLTFTRGAWAGLFCAAVVMFFIRKDKRKFLWLLLVIPVIFIVLFSSVRRRALAVFLPEGRESARIFFLKKVPSMIAESPVIGHGPDTFRKNFYSRYPDFPEQGHFHPHNVYLSIAYQTGLVGLAVWLAMFYFITASLSGIFKKRGFSVGSPAMMAWGALGSVVSFFVHGFVDETFRAYEAPYALFFICAAAIVAGRVAANSSGDKKDIAGRVL